MDAVKIQCYMPVRNEADILPHTLRHLHEQGCSVHVIDGWSTDGSYEYAEGSRLWNAATPLEPQVSVERFPADGPDPIQNCTAILNRIEHLAESSDADWILYSDADEWRRAPGKLRFVNDHGGDYDAGDKLINAVTRIDYAGWNAIDFRVFQFYCTDLRWNTFADYASVGGGVHDHRVSPEDFFRYYDEADCISRIPNRKLWKNVGRVCLGGGGHEVMFPGMRVYPQKFTMKHYPFRTPAQAKAKIDTRLARRRKEEHDKGWGVHYDQYPPGFDFCWDPAKLKFWKDTRSPLP